MNKAHFLNWRLVRHGVPQGSILGPLLFLLYINDLPRVLSHTANMVLYADDTSVIVTNPNPSDFASNVNKIFSEISTWFKNNLLSLNAKKTTYLQFRTKNGQKLDFDTLALNNQITASTSTKFLGIIIDEKLTWYEPATIKAKLSMLCH